MSSRLKLLLPGAFLVAATAVVGFAMMRDEGPEPVLTYRPMPEFTLALLDDPLARLSEQDLPAGLVLLNVWGSWCAPCRAEHPMLMEIAARERGLTLVGVNYLDRPDSARAFLAEMGDPFQVNLLDGAGVLGRALGVEGAPESFLVDASGAIRYRHQGVIDERVWKRIFKPLIEQIVQ